MRINDGRAIPTFICQVLRNEAITIYGNGKQERSYNFSEDTARGTVDALFSDKADNMIMNIGNSNALISLKELGELVIKICGKQNELEINIKNSY